MKKQRGLMLVLALLVLVSITILGVSAVSSGLLQSKMASSVQRSGLAFDAAETAISGVLYESEDATLLSTGALDPLSEARLIDAYDVNAGDLQCTDDDRIDRFVTTQGLSDGTRQTVQGDFQQLPTTQSWSRTAFVREQSCLGSSAVIGGLNINCHVFVVRGCGQVQGKPAVVANTLAVSVFAPATAN